MFKCYRMTLHLFTLHNLSLGFGLSRLNYFFTKLKKWNNCDFSQGIVENTEYLAILVFEQGD